MNEPGTAAADALADELAEGAGIALYGEAGPAALAEPTDGAGVVPSTDAVLARYDEGGGAFLVEVDGTSAGEY